MANSIPPNANNNGFYYEPQRDYYSFKDEVKLPATPFSLTISAELISKSLKTGPAQIVDILATEADNIINHVMDELYEQVQAQVYTKLTAAAQTLYQQPIESLRPKKPLPTGYDIPEGKWITQEQYEEIKKQVIDDLNKPNPLLKMLEPEKPYDDAPDNYTLLMKFKQHHTQQKQSKAIITDIAEA